MESTPRTWGEHFISSLLNILFGINPHARGVNCIKFNKGDFVSESPPRTWGEQHCPYDGFHKFRINPTHVGRTARVYMSTKTLPNQPHARGENQQLTHTSLNRLESTPRTWGERILFGSPVESIRINPTHVGRTPPLNEIGFFTKNQPHARGENRFSQAYL